MTKFLVGSEVTYSDLDGRHRGLVIEDPSAAPGMVCIRWTPQGPPSKKGWRTSHVLVPENDGMLVLGWSEDD